MAKRIADMTPEELMERALRGARRDSERAKRYRDRRKQEGMVRLAVYVPEDAADHVRAAMRQALADWLAGDRQPAVPPPPPHEPETKPAAGIRVLSSAPEVPVESGAGSVVHMRLDFPTTVAVAPIREELHDRGFLFLLEHNGWCGEDNFEVIHDLVRDCHGKVTTLDPESLMVRAWRRRRPE